MHKKKISRFFSIFMFHFKLSRNLTCFWYGLTVSLADGENDDNNIAVMVMINYFIKSLIDEIVLSLIFSRNRSLSSCQISDMSRIWTLHTKWSFPLDIFCISLLQAFPPNLKSIQFKISLRVKRGLDNFCRWRQHFLKSDD